MPYVITTSNPGATGRTKTGVILSRRAVATLEEAREAARELLITGAPGVGTGALSAYVSVALHLPESGGSVGPLPDGTEIEVRVPTATERERVRLSATPILSPRCSDQEWCDAFNAREAARKPFSASQDAE